MGKASKKKSGRRKGIGPPRTEIESTVRDTALLNQLDPYSTTSENALETLVTDKLLAPRDALLAGLAVLAALAGLCRSNAVSVLAEA
jgi:hypothetical protein